MFVPYGILHDSSHLRCHHGCKWTAEKGKLYLFIGSAGIFERLICKGMKQMKHERQRLAEAVLLPLFCPRLVAPAAWQKETRKSCLWVIVLLHLQG